MEFYKKTEQSLGFFVFYRMVLLALVWGTERISALSYSRYLVAYQEPSGYEQRAADSAEIFSNLMKVLNPTTRISTTCN